jgi:hypothetical protein
MCRDQGYIARAAADIEHRHSGSDPCILEEVPRGRIEKPGALLKASLLVVGPPEYVVRIALVFAIHRLPPRFLASIAQSAGRDV